MEEVVDIERKGLILDIDRFSTHDGPGIRTTVFLKGCPLRCQWCHSPESQWVNPELLYQYARCRGCFQCIWACPEQAISKKDAIIAGEKGSIKIDRELCTQCFKCVDGCFSKALRVAGGLMTVEETMGIIQQDIPFYKNSNGGVTISGGEPLYQADFVLELVEHCRWKGIHIALETSGYGKYNELKAIADKVNLIFYDIKLMDSELHQKYTGKPNKLILDNIKALCADSQIVKKILVRIPCIPYINDAPEQIHKTANFMFELGIKEMELMPYNQMASSKYEWMDRTYSLTQLKTRSKDYYQHLNRLVAETGLSVVWNQSIK